MPRTKTAVHWMVEGEALVRGTTDPVVALGLAMDETTNGGWHWEDAVEDRPEPHVADREIEAHALVAANFCFNRLDPKNHSVGWFRMNPVGPDHPDGWTWQLGRETGPGRGNFQGVIFE